MPTTEMLSDQKLNSTEFINGEIVALAALPGGRLIVDALVSLAVGNSSQAIDDDTMARLKRIGLVTKDSSVHPKVVEVLQFWHQLTIPMTSK